MAHRILRLPEVKLRTGLSKSSIYNGIANGTFAQRIRLSPHCVGWDEQSIEIWIEQRMATAQVSCTSPSKQL